MRSRSQRIEALIAKGDWPRARALIRTELKKNPGSHWLLARLALTHYEERDYKRALELDIEALQIAPECPLACWDYAGSCSMLGKNKQALVVYEWLIERGVDDIAFGECGEGRVGRERSSPTVTSVRPFAMSLSGTSAGQERRFGSICEGEVLDAAASIR